MAMVKAAAIYARISSDQEGTGLGVARQVEDCRKLAEKLGWPIGEEYVDNDYSATNGKPRPAYARMLDDLRTRDRDAVIVYHVDRLTRRPIELEQFVAVIDEARIQHVRFIEGDSDVTTSDGLVFARILGALAANESATKSRRLKRKIEQNAAAGLPNGGALRPFGYESDRVTVNEAEAVIVRQLVTRFLAGERGPSLVIWLNAEGVPTVTGKAWRTTTVREILVSPRRAGLREHLGVVVGPAVWPAIITEEQHRRVVALMRQNANSGRRAARRYLLSGMLRCGKCDNRLYSMPRESKRRYVCNSGPDHGGCGHLTVVAEPVETLIAEMVLYRLDTPALADALAGRMAADEHTAALTEQLTSDRAELDELAAVRGQGQITTREWMIVRAPIEARIRSAERRMSSLTGADALAGLVGQGEALRGTWQTLNLDRQVAIVKSLLDYAVIGPGVSGARTLDPTRVDPKWRL
jgi:site-specific DNA recombinase